MRELLKLGLVSLLLSAAFPLGSTVLIAGEEARTLRNSASIETVELFAAIQKQQLVVTVRPRDAREVRVEIENKTDQPLRVQFPQALVAMPVLAQFLPNNPFGPPGGNIPGVNGQGPGQNPQVLGVAPQQNNPFPGNGRNQQQFIFNVPAEKVIRVTMPSLCLEYGKREPNPRNPYVLRPLESFTDSVPVRELLEHYGQGKHNTEVTQIAAWHLASGLSWEKMAGMTQRRSFGKVENVFNQESLKSAKKMVDGLPSQQQKDRSAVNRLVSVSESAKP